MKNPKISQTAAHCSNDSCEIRDAFMIIGGKWKSMILYALAKGGVVRFNKLKQNIQGISQKMLTQQLRELERDGLITRVIYPEIPPRVEYSMSELGLSLGPIYQMVHHWERENYSTVEMCRRKYYSSTK